MILRPIARQNASVVVETVKLKRDAERIVKQSPNLTFRKVGK
jgi:hypothetical protein